jgi:hypothetical protein
MKPRIAFFAAASLVATGMTLASNVSFGQKAGKLLADAYEVMGPISSLISGIVKPNLEKPARPTGDYNGEAVAASVRQDTVSQAMRSQSMLPTNIVGMAPAIQFVESNAGITSKRGPTMRIEAGSGDVPARFANLDAPAKTLKPSLLSAFEKGSPGSLSKDREDVWHFLNSRPGQFDNGKLALSDRNDRGERSERVDKEVLGNTTNAAAPIQAIVNAMAPATNDIIGTTNANNLTAQSLLSKNSVAPVPVPASALVLVAGFASLFGVSLMAKKSKAKKSKKAAK